MSWVVTVVLSFGVAEEFDEDENHLESVPALDGINAWLQERHKAGLLDMTVNNGQPMQASIYGGAFKLLDIEAFVQLVKAQPWLEPENVQLLVKDDDEERFTLYEFTDD